MSSAKWPSSAEDQRFEGHQVCTKKEIDFMCSKCELLDLCKKSPIMGELLEEPAPEEVTR